MRPRRPPAVHALVLGLAVLATACSVVGTAPPTEPAAEPVRVAAGPDSESLLLAHVMAAMLELDGLPAEVVGFSDARDARRAIERGDAELRPAYTGEAWLEVLGRADPPGDPRDSVTAVAQHDVGSGLIWLRPRYGDGLGEPPANATFAFVVQGPPSVDADIATLSQLASRLSERPEARVCVDRDFGTRPDGLRAVLAAYSVRSDLPFLAASPREAVLGVVAGDCLAGLTTATDGVAWAAGLRPLRDDLRVFPAFVPLPQLRADAIARQPGVRRAVVPLASHLSTQLLGSWNARVALGEPVEVVAADAARVLFDLHGRVPDTEIEDGE